jgi:hypothetical protein
MKKLYCTVCDNPACRKVCINIITIKGKKRQLHYCSEECAKTHKK